MFATSILGISLTTILIPHVPDNIWFLWGMAIAYLCIGVTLFIFIDD